MDNKWNYKNFNMVVELDVSGEFIYNGIHEIYRLSEFSNDGPTFSALYNISVGIERLQKIVYVLWGMDSFCNDEEFEKSLITHSHTGLRDKINNILKEKGERITFNERENDFLSLLTTFYNSARYMRFNVAGENDKEVTLLRYYITKYANENTEDLFFDERIIATDKAKQLFGRVVGSITKKYYKLLKKGSNNNKTYTYELRGQSKAAKVFSGEYNKNSLIDGQIDEQIALKELLIYLRCAKNKNAFFKFVDEIEPLAFDPPMAIEYLQEIVTGNVPQYLIDDVEYMYSEHQYSIDRVKLISLFASTQFEYDYPLVDECWKIIQRIRNGEMKSEDVEILKEKKNYIEDEDLVDIIDKVICQVEIYQEKNNANEFYEAICELSEEYQPFLIAEKSEDK